MMKVTIYNFSEDKVHVLKMLIEKKLIEIMSIEEKYEV